MSRAVISRYVVYFAQPVYFRQTPSDVVPTKKNRLQDSVIKEEQASASTSAVPAAIAQPSSPSLRGAEGEKVGHIRKRVQDLSWKQRKEGNRDGQDEEEEEAEVIATQTQSKDDKGADQSAPAAEEDPKPKRIQPSFSSFSTKSSGFAAASATKGNGVSFLSSPSPTSQQSEKKEVASPSGNRSQPTFSSFSKSSSPFSTASDVAGPSWLAGKNDSAITTKSISSSGGGIRPSTLGTVASSNSHSNKPAQSVSLPSESKEVQAKVLSPVPEATSDGQKQLGFGAFTNSKTFTSSRATPSTNESEKGANGDAKGEAREAQTFDEVLQQTQGGRENSHDAEKSNTHFEGGQVDLRTGEEDEKTLTSARAKLYTMSDDKNWKERGTGTVRCNIAKEEGGAARLGESS